MHSIFLIRKVPKGRLFIHDHTVGRIGPPLPLLYVTMQRDDLSLESRAPETIRTPQWNMSQSATTLLSSVWD